MIPDDFLVRAVLAGLGVALAAGPIGCFVVWRRMAYFSDATAHAAILGVALSVALSLSVFAGVLAAALLLALTVSALGERGLPIDTLLGVLAHSMLAFGLVAASLAGAVAIDLEAYLFGDILAVTSTDVVVIWGGALAVVALLGWRWSRLVTATLSPELAHAAGIEPRRETLVLTVALALVVAVAIKVVGALLIGAMMVIPAATARGPARTPEAMAAWAVVLGAVAVLGGVWASFEADTPTGPTIVSVSALMFLVAQAMALLPRHALPDRDRA